MNGRLDNVEERIEISTEGLNAKIGAVDTRIDTQIGAVNTSIEASVKGVEGQIVAVNMRIDTLQRVIWPLLAMVGSSIIGLLARIFIE